MEVFRKIDTDKSGSIDEGELKKFLEDQLHIQGSRIKAHQMLEIADENHDGKISEEEFMHMMRKLQKRNIGNATGNMDHIHDINKTRYVRIDEQVKK